MGVFMVMGSLAQTYKTIGDGTTGQSNVPFNGYYDYGWSAMIYPQSDIDYEGDITEIAFYVDNTPSSYQKNDQKIYMGHESDSEFSSTSKPDPSNLTKVFDGNLTWDGSGWHTITLDDAFGYNNSDNLLVYYENRDGEWESSQPEFRYTSSHDDDNAIYNNDDGSFPTDDGSYYNYPNIKLTMVEPSGPANPSGFSASASGSNQIGLSWTLNGDSDDVLLAYNSSSSFGTPSDGTTYSVDDELSGGGTIIYTGSSTSHSHTSLSSNTQYYYKIWSKDGSDNYSTGTTDDATTDCAAVSSFPFSVGFEDPYPLDCWGYEYGSASPENDMTHSTDEANSGSQSFRFSSYNNDSDSYEQFLISPELDMSSSKELSFYYKRSGDGQTETYKVGISTTGTDVNNDFSWETEVSDASTSWQEYTLEIDANVKYIAVKYTSDFQYYLYLDDFVIDDEACSSIPSVTTSSVSSITTNSAESGGEVTDAGTGNCSVSARGVCWNKTGSPDTGDNKTTDGSGTGSYTSSLTGLDANTTYYVRAYATNDNGTDYGDPKSFTTDEPPCSSSPTVTTNDISSITLNSAESGGEVTDDGDGDCTVSARGVCWNTAGSPDINDNTTTDGSGTGSFTSSLTGLDAGTTYYVKAYATNGEGTAYGSEKSFTTNTVSIPGTPTSNSPQCGTVTITRSGSPLSGEEWYWQTAVDGTSTANSGETYDVSASGIYYIRAYSSSEDVWGDPASCLVEVRESPANVSAGTDCNICNGTTTQLNGSADDIDNYLIQEDFEDGSFPDTWNVDEGVFEWWVDNDYTGTGIIQGSNHSSRAYIQTTSTEQDAWIKTPTLEFPKGSGSIEFTSFFMGANDGIFTDVEHDYVKISTDGGSTWTEIADMPHDYPDFVYDTGEDWGTFSFSLDSYLSEGDDNVIIAFHRVTDGDGGNGNWGIDNFSVVSTERPVFSWSSDPSGFSSDAEDPDASPTETTVYTLETSSGDCTSSDDVTVTVKEDGTWMGSTNSDWHTDANWCGTVPGASDDVVLFSEAENVAEIESGNASVNGLTIENGMSLSITNDNTLNVSGDFTNNGTFNAGTSHVTFDGSTVQNITSGSDNFYDVTFNNSNAGNADIILNDDLTIDNSASFTNGIVDANSNTVIFASGATSNDGNANSFVDGKITKQNFSSAFTFPAGDVNTRDIGDGEQTYTIWSPVDINPQVSTTVNVKYVFDNEDGGVSMPEWWYHVWTHQAPLVSVSDREFWLVNASENIDVELHWKNNDPCTTHDICESDLSRYLTIAHWDNNDDKWKEGSNIAIETSGTTNGSISGTIPFSSTKGEEKYVGLASKDDDTTLPVELLDFNANCQTDAVTLSWTTASEINNDHFIVERRSQDGNNWTKIVSVPGAGNSNQVNHYSAEDKQPFEGINYYRLKQIDFNGETTTFAPVQVNCVANQETATAIKLYPNPFHTDLFVIMENLENQKVIINVFDNPGKLVLKETITPADDYTTHRLNLEDMTAGMYYVRITTDNSTIHKQIIKK